MPQSLLNLRYALRLELLQAKGYLKSLRKQQDVMDEPIDFVVTWVDGNDVVWQQEKAKYAPPSKKGNTDARYREWNQFMYWFRAVEKYAPWVRKVHLITWGHLPPWLNTSHPKLKIVKHTEYIPERYLPSFNSIPIELNIHRIPDLSEHFIYFNDDMYLTRPVVPTDFFCNGLPKYCAEAIPVRNYRYNGPFAHQQFGCIGLINGVYNVCSAIESHPELWFSKCYGKNRRYNKNAYQDAYLPGMFFSHLGCPYRKSTLRKAWEVFAPELDATCTHRFRTSEDVMHQLFSLSEIMEGTFVPVAQEHYGVKFGTLSKEQEAIKQAFVSKKYRMVCLNDSTDVTSENFDEIRGLLSDTLQQTFPEKSRFEK